MEPTGLRQLRHFRRNPGRCDRPSVRRALRRDQADELIRPIWYVRRVSGRWSRQTSGMGSAGEVLCAMLAAFDTGRVGDVATYVDADYVDHQGLHGEHVQGTEGFARVVDAARNSYDALIVSIEDLIEEGDRAAARVRWAGTRATGEVVRRETFEIVHVKDGRAIEHSRAAAPDACRVGYAVAARSAASTLPVERPPPGFARRRFHVGWPISPSVVAVGWGCRGEPRLREPERPAAAARASPRTLSEKS